MNMLIYFEFIQTSKHLLSKVLTNFYVLIFKLLTNFIFKLLTNFYVLIIKNTPKLNVLINNAYKLHEPIINSTC